MTRIKQNTDGKWEVRVTPRVNGKFGKPVTIYRNTHEDNARLVAAVSKERGYGWTPTKGTEQ